MSLKDMMKSVAQSAVQQAQDAAKNAMSDIAEAREIANREFEEEKALKAALGRPVSTITGVDGSKMTLYANGIEFSSKDKDLNPGKRLFSVVNSIALEDGEELQARVTVTRVLLTGVFALALKKKSGGTKYITVDGEDLFWPMEVDRKHVKDAQKFVMKARSLMAKQH